MDHTYVDPPRKAMAIDVSSAPSYPTGNTLHRLAQFGQVIAPPIATGLAYLFAAKAGAWLAFPSAPVSALWAPNAILLAALLLALTRAVVDLPARSIAVSPLRTIAGSTHRTGRDRLRREHRRGGARRLGHPAILVPIRAASIACAPSSS